MDTMIDPTTITNLECAQDAIRQLLNLVESLSRDLRATQEEMQRLRDENRRLQGEQAMPVIPPNRSDSPDRPSDHSSERERHVPRKRGKQAKNKTISINRDVTLELDPTMLPKDAERKGYEAVIIQDVVFRTDNVRFHKAKWYAPSTGKTYLAPLPNGYEGQFGPVLKALILVWSFASQMSARKIGELLGSVGIQISAGQVSHFLTKDHEPLHAEKAAIVDAGLASAPWQQTDDTATRVNGHNHYCHVLCNPLYTAYTTIPHKDRLSVLAVLHNERALSFVINTESIGYLERIGIAPSVLERVRQMPTAHVVDETTFDQWLREHVPKAGPKQHKWIREAAAIAAYHQQQEVPVIALLVCDDAPQFKLLTEEIAGCWVHDARHYKKLMPRMGYHHRLLCDFEHEYWSLYHALLQYRESPSAEERARLDAWFDTLFSHVTGYDALDARIAKTREKQSSLLLVLTHPEIPLHNNAAELACRARVRKRDVSFGPRTADGVKMWDTGMTLGETAKKLGVSFYHYMHDRISGAMQMPSLASLIAERAAELTLDASWKPVV